MVVTGEAGAARRREIGNTISQLDVATLREPVRSIEGILQGRAPGLMVAETVMDLM